MNRLFCRRLRMEVDLRLMDLIEPSLPQGYRWIEWSPELLERHATVKWQSFQGELDGVIFQSLSGLKGCRMLMQYITQNVQFVPEATWLLVHDATDMGRSLDCGTVQGLAMTPELGAIQNVGIAQSHRSRGLGRALVEKALRGFQQFGLHQVSLEVTADNLAAVRLYSALGFRLTKTLFRDVE